MRICIISDDYMPDSIKSAGRMMHELALEFRSQGHEVMVITPAVGASRSWYTEEFEGIFVGRFKSGRIKNVSKPIRALNEMLLSSKAFRAGKETFKAKPADVIVYYSPTIFFGELVARLKKLWGAKSFLILRDIFPQWVVDHGMLSDRSPIIRLFRIFERINYRAADVIGLQSPANLEYFKRYFPEPGARTVLYNWSLPVNAKGTGQWRDRLGLQKKTIFFYGGNLGHAQDMGQILRLADALQTEAQAHFLLVGAGDEVPLIQRYVQEAKVKNVTYLEAVSQGDFQVMMAETDIGLFSLHRNHTTHNFPGKVLAYLAQGLPILGAVNPGNDIQTVISGADAGFVCESGDDQALLPNAKALLDAGQRARMSRNASKLLKETFSVRSATRKILSSIEQLDTNGDMGKRDDLENGAPPL